MKKLITICTVIMLCLCIFSGCGKKAQKETIVKLVFDGKTIEVTNSQWNEKAVHITTKDTSLGNDKVYEFIGVKLSDLMEIAGAGECTKAIVNASDGYNSEVLAEDIKEYDIALVNGYASGKPIPEDAGGPLKLIFPISDHPELSDEYDLWSWMWYVYEIEFVK